MKKPIPPQKFREVRPPHEHYTYFEDKDKAGHQFIPSATGFEMVNASWLADFAMLAYGDEEFIKTRFDQSGLTAAGFDLKFFSGKTTQCFVTRNSEFVVLCFRGTEMDNFMGGFEDWRRNLELIAEVDESGGLVHIGFQKDLKSVWQEVKNYLQPLITDGAGRTLWITGHSLGAALATLAAERAARDGPFKVQGVYPYGSPRIGDVQFKEKYAALGLDAITFRFINNRDVVPKLPPATPYVHVGQIKFIDSNGLLHDAKPRHAEGLEQLLERIGHRGAALLEDWIEQTIPAPFADHSPIYYGTYIWNNLP